MGGSEPGVQGDAAPPVRIGLSCLLHLENFLDLRKFQSPYIIHICPPLKRNPIPHRPPNLLEGMRGGGGRDREYWLKLIIYLIINIYYHYIIVIVFIIASFTWPANAL